MPLAIRFWELLMQQGILTNSSRASRFPHWAQSSCETLLVMWSNEFFNSSSRNLPMCPGTSWCFVFFYGTSWHPEEQLKNEIAWVNVAACLVLVLISPWIEWFPEEGHLCFYCLFDAFVLFISCPIRFALWFAHSYEERAFSCPQWCFWVLGALSYPLFTAQLRVLLSLGHPAFDKRVERYSILRLTARPSVRMLQHKC